MTNNIQIIQFRRMYDIPVHRKISYRKCSVAVVQKCDYRGKTTVFFLLKKRS